VLCDYFFKGTPGKRVFGMRVVSIANNEFTLLTSFIRAFFTLLVPVILASLLTDYIDPFRSQFMLFLEAFLRAAVICLIPVSILFFGGDQGVVDSIVGTAVEGSLIHKREAHGRGNRRKLALSIATSLVFGAIVAGFASFSVGEYVFGSFRKLPTSSIQTRYKAIQNPKFIGYLWARLPQGLKTPSSEIADIEVIEMSPNLFRVGGSTFLAPVSCKNDFESADPVHLLHISLLPQRSLGVRALLISNALNVIGHVTPLKDRPFFVVLEFASRTNFGPFDVEYVENGVLCFVGSGAVPRDFYVDARPPGTIGVASSLDQIRRLLLWDITAIELVRYR
jgi:hypothetical protein